VRAAFKDKKNFTKQEAFQLKERGGYDNVALCPFKLWLLLDRQLMIY